MKKLPIGIENFKEIATDCYYVDKTLLIKELIDLPIGTSILFTRPCRFGKSLNLSMLQTYFEQGEDSRLYFEGKAIMSQEKSYLSEMSAHPVIRLVMKNAIGSDWATLYAKIKTIVASEYQRHCSLLDENVLSEQERRFFSSILDLSAPESDFSSALSQLALFLFRSSKKTVVVLLDEYDAPIEEARQNGFFDEAIAFFRSFYGEALKGNDSMLASTS
jgi:Predicted AAA-ATPase.